MNPQTRTRIALLLIAAAFLGSFGLAAVPRFSGWTPSGGTNYGVLLKNPIDARAITVTAADGRAYPWQSPQHPWRIVVFAPPVCPKSCAELSRSLERVWRTEGRHAERLHVLWFGAVPEGGANFRNLWPMREAPELRAVVAPVSAGPELPAYLIDPNGFVVMRYEPGFDAAGMRRDLGHLLK